MQVPQDRPHLHHSATSAQGPRPAYVVWHALLDPLMRALRVEVAHILLEYTLQRNLVLIGKHLTSSGHSPILAKKWMR